METDRRIAYHLTPRVWFEGRDAAQPYLPEPFEQDGFVHLTHGEAQVLAVGNMFYRSTPGDWLVLTIDLAALSAPLRYDDPEQRFPHIYGPLDRRAITAVRCIERTSDGEFLAIAPEA